jgi:uncharacterized BrkB/YihY/UPF0761 family membrane protein
MLNTKSLLGIMVVLCLCLVFLGLTRFAVDTWHYYQADTNIPALNKRGLGGAGAGGLMALVFFVLYRCLSRKSPKPQA